MLRTKYFLSSILLLGIIASIVLGDEIPMIVGGNDADRGEYPYYVYLSGCGGTLIAPDMVLTAAHCRSYISDSNRDIYVGAYRRDNADGLAQVRRCVSYTTHPHYSFNTIDNDVALCKLNETVSIDQSRARLELNDDNSSPSHGDSLTVIGLGRLQFGANSPNKLQEVEEPAISNDICTSPSVYGGNNGWPEVTENMLCAGHLDGGRGHCSGDSGGPLVQINGDVHTLVGVVSWSGKSNDQGDEGCAIEDKPGVFARVSRFEGWIRRNACNMGSSADFCDDTFLPTGAPTPSPITPTDSPTLQPTPKGDFPIQDECGAGNGGLRFQANLHTDTWGSETSISSYSFNQDYTALDKLIFRRDYNLGDDTKYYFPSDDNYYCLENHRCYYFEVTDSFGDGILGNDDNDPIFEGFLGKQRKFKGSPGGWHVHNNIFCTGNACKDKNAFKIGNNRKNCKDYVTGSLKAMRRKCNKKINRGGDPVHKHCPETCGRKAGVGKCRWWKVMEKRLKKAAEAPFQDTDTMHQKIKGIN